MGRTFSESWHRVADLRAHLRPQVRARRQTFRGERWMVLHDPYNNQFFRLRPAAYAFVSRLSPKVSVGEAWEATLAERPEDAPGQQDVVELLAQLYQSNLLVADVPADTSALFQRYRKRVQREVKAKVLGAMFARFPLWDPDDFLERVKGISKLIFNRWTAVVWMIVFVVGLSSVAGASNELAAQSRRVLDPSNLPWLLLMTALMKAAHEFGHMALCKICGGTVRRAGILLMIFTPMPYADTTAAWGFRERSQRVLVGFGGMIVEVFLASLAAILWANSGDGLARDLAFNAMLVGSISTLLFNLNPLLRFDGYFILSDLSGIPNLYQRSLQYLRYLSERYLFGLRREVSPAHDRTEAWVFAVYGVAGAIYRFFLFGSILLIVWDRFLLLGLVMGVVCVIAWVVTPTGKLIKYLTESPKLHLQRSRAVATTVGLAIALVMIVRWLPLPQAARAEGQLQAIKASAVATGASGRLAELIAKPGTWVEEGQEIALLENPELLLALREIEAQVEEARARARQALAEDPASVQVFEGYLDALRERLDELRRRRDGLLVKAPHEGWWAADGVEELLGGWLTRGSPLGEILNTNGFEFRVEVPVDRAARLVAAAQASAVVRLNGQPWSRLEIGESRLVAASVANRSNERTQEADTIPYFEYRGQIVSNGGATMLHGQAGQIRFRLEPESLWSKLRRIWGEFMEKRSSSV